MFVCQEETAGQEKTVPEVVSQAAADPQTESETPEAEESKPATEAVSADGRININTAGVEELTTLKGVGESRANAIIAFREEHGSFENPEDIMQIAGIKEGIYAKIKDQIKVR